uniref:Uncharacterized protein n=1 Tax=Pithovirus LCPAC401 TaxID=2506595 RepID=A0A481ZBG7_9VIRU|nr:MAG: hypothetical protein LCPAC401_01380 [Pithovirus LCPAC401]
MAVYHIYDHDGHVGYFTHFSDAKKEHDKSDFSYQNHGIGLLKLDEKSGEFKSEDWWGEDDENSLRKITKEEIKRLPDEIFSFQGCEWDSMSSFIDEESMLEYLAKQYGDDLSHIKPTRENFAIYTLSWFRDSCTFDYAVESAIDLEEGIARTKINTVTRRWKSPGEIYVPLMDREKLRREFEKIREPGHENCSEDTICPMRRRSPSEDIEEHKDTIASEPAYIVVHTESGSTDIEVVIGDEELRIYAITYGLEKYFNNEPYLEKLRTIEIGELIANAHEDGSFSTVKVTGDNVEIENYTS